MQTTERIRASLSRHAISGIPRLAVRAVLGPSDGAHLASGRVAFEGLEFDLCAPYYTWGKAADRGVEPRISRFIMQECRPGMYGLDVGANVGFLSLVMAFCVGPSGRVLSIEADRNTQAILARNVVSNALLNTCTPLLTRVGMAPDTPVDRLVSEWSFPRVDFIKIDVDGADLAALKSAAATITRFHPTIVVEITQDQEAVYDLLRAEYPYVTGMYGEVVTPGKWPANLFASTRPIHVPEWGFRMEQGRKGMVGGS